MEAPTAGSVGGATSDDELDETIIKLKLVQSFPRVFSREDDYFPPAPPIGLYFYASEIYFDTYENIISFAARQDQLPEELHERYRLSRRICLGLLGETENIPDYEMLFTDLTNVVSQSQKPRKKATEAVSTVHADTLHGANDELKELERDDAPYSYTQFLSRSEDLFDTLKQQFLLYDQTVFITEHDVPTLTASDVEPWKLKEVNEDLEHIVPKWEEALQEVGDKGLEKMNDLNNQSEGCFIATAAAGADHKKVSTLRDFRDDLLKQYRSGRMFIRFYYWSSPPIADWIRRSERRKRVARWLIVTPAYWFSKILGV
ncbi:CFI-box-CTERM domain-containing protein [Halorubrum ezzemoulense]|uniref:CFI-box-CTERM domain-containing protein n=1 Tax=Halorubrum ezzemoulense TaxID=337243 RepID=UPI00232A868F|nr:CFI-box-CTERM domain-containing protein [Halorubrum ezzemoulense]MDB2240014.1 hypothetical protein [Halorubrum ezzemoulense]